MQMLRCMKTSSRALIVLGVIFVLSRGLSAQVLYGSLTGNVSDASGAVAVEALNVATGVSCPFGMPARLGLSRLLTSPFTR